MSFINGPVRFLRTLLHDPKLTAPILIALLYYPEKLQSILPSQIHPYLNRLTSSPTVLNILKAFFAVGVLGKLSNSLSNQVVNNWKGNAKFVKSQELVLITGGCSGIGLLMAKDFAKRGVTVVVLDLNPPKDGLPSGVHYYKGDVTKSDEISALATEIRKNHGEPTVLINNAGIGSMSTILGGTEESTRKTFEVNTMSHFIMVREFLPAMIKKNHGHVVTIASFASYVAIAQNVDYSCTKASALAFHEGLATELKSRYNAPNIRTTVVNPTWVRTPLIEPLIAQPGWTDPVLEAEAVSSPIVEHIISGKSGQLILPKELNLISTIRGWPSWMQYSLRNSQSRTLDYDESIMQ